MRIEFGSLEYFELLGLQDKLKGYRLDGLELENLDRLRSEIERKVEAIHLVRKQQIESKRHESPHSK